MIKADGLRLDRGFYTTPVWLGLFCTGIYVLLTPENLPGFSETKGNILGGLLGLAAGVCVVASLLKDWRRAFRIELWGLSVMVAVMVVLDFVAPLSPFQQLTLVGGLGFWIQVGSIRMIVMLIRALRIAD
jgi:hypothetical protein